MGCVAKLCPEHCVAQAKADAELCCPALPLNSRWRTETCESQKTVLLCPAWAALPASQCAPGLSQNFSETTTQGFYYCLPKESCLCWNFLGQDWQHLGACEQLFCLTIITWKASVVWQMDTWHVMTIVSIDVSVQTECTVTARPELHPHINVSIQAIPLFQHHPSLRDTELDSEGLIHRTIYPDKNSSWW